MKLRPLPPEEVRTIIRPVLVELAEATGLTLHDDGFSLVEPETAEVRVSVSKRGHKEWRNLQDRLVHVLHVHVSRHKTIKYKLTISEYLPSNGYRAEVNMKPLLKRIKAVRGEAKEIAKANRLRRAREAREGERRKQEALVLGNWTGLPFKDRYHSNQIYRAKLDHHVIDLNMSYEDNGDQAFRLEVTNLSLEKVNAMLQALSARVKTRTE